MIFSNFDYSHMLGFGIGALLGFGIFTFAVIIGLIALKGYALWTASKRDEPMWFVALLVVNTVGILELIYLYFVANKFRSANVKSIENNHNHNHDHSHSKNHESHNG